MDLDFQNEMIIFKKLLATFKASSILEVAGVTKISLSLKPNHQNKVKLVQITDAERFTDLGKLNFQMLAWFQARANFQYCPSSLQKYDSKGVKTEPKWIILLH